MYYDKRDHVMKAKDETRPDDFIEISGSKMRKLAAQGESCGLMSVFYVDVWYIEFYSTVYPISFNRTDVYSKYIIFIANLCAWD